MAERTITYRTKEEREQIIDEAESRGETMLHDDHHTPIRGTHTLTFHRLTPDAPRVDTPVELLERRVQNSPHLITLDDLITLERERLLERER